MMSIQKKTVLWACTLVLLSGINGVSRVQAADETKRIGVVNMTLVFESYAKVKDVQDELTKLFEQEQKAIHDKSVKLKDREAVLRTDGRPKTDINFFKEVQLFELAKMTLELEFQELAKRVEEKRRDKMLIVLNNIKTAIRFIGTAEKYDLIMRAPEFDGEFKSDATPEDKKKLESKTADELVRKFRDNPVMYFAPGVDITGKVIAKLNDDYKAEKNPK
jgi:Skp family chaperone for outer membrane proteins